MQILVFLGSSRDSTPPGPARLGARVAVFCCNALRSRGHHVELVDPLDIETGSVFKPHFAYRKGQAPGTLDKLSEQIYQADAYVMISPEYNHSMSPALAHLLNHFGSSLFSYKPSAIVTYSAGQWGGARAAMAMRPFLSELGCLPVSAMLPIPTVANVFDAEGDFLPGVDSDNWRSYAERVWQQLEWWGEAALVQRGAERTSMTSAFSVAPEQRNAPA